MIIGYSLIYSIDDVDDPSQQRAFDSVGVEKVHVDTALRGQSDQPELHKMLDRVQTTDTVVVSKLHRLSRSLAGFLAALQQIESSGATFRSLAERIDTATSAGRTMMPMVRALSDFHQITVRERVIEGLESARAEGRAGGRQPKLTSKQRAEIRDTVSSGRFKAAKAAQIWGVAPSTVSRIVNG